MFKKILIANRGEIAIRIMRTAKRLGMTTVAVYSEADRTAAHVRAADEALLIGPASAAESYLDPERLLGAARRSGAEAIHPGYGFLSENADFARACEQENRIFVGPPPDAIAMMGDKLRAKELAGKVGVALAPGGNAPVTELEEVRQLARTIGYPLMVKAAAGGGGKGMRLVREESELASALAMAGSEAKASFGDERLFLERFIERPRHIEIQIIADHHGQVEHLGERECSIQRRHQKLIEETPSPFVDKAMRQKMGEQAVALARALEYRSVGTIEYIVDQEGNHYFLEMNTRLQVEHPVTELVYGVDLVEWMMRIAAGEKLSLGKRQRAPAGWAMELRICAEAPERDFLPSSGRIDQMLAPSIGLVAGENQGKAGLPSSPSPSTDGEAMLRFDSGFEEGDTVSIHYDSMLAKLIAYAPTRDGAIAALRTGLDDLVIDGVDVNTSFLYAMLEDTQFRGGELTTELIAERFADGFRSDILGPAGESDLLLALAAWEVARRSDPACPAEPTTTHLVKPGAVEWLAVANDTEFRVRIVGNNVWVDDRLHEFSILARQNWPVNRIRLCWDGVAVGVQVKNMGSSVFVRVGARALRIWVYPGHIAALLRYMPYESAEESVRFLRAPMPGMLMRLSVERGDLVSPGQEIAVIVAMKMENLLRAEYAGRVEEILARPGDSLAADQPIIEFVFEGKN